MSIVPITDEETFWAYIQLGVLVYCRDEYTAEVNEVNAAGCLSALTDGDAGWLQDFRNRWLPSGDYYVTTE